MPAPRLWEPPARLWPEHSPPGLDTFSRAGLQIFRWGWGGVCWPRPLFWYFPWRT